MAARARHAHGVKRIIAAATLALAVLACGGDPAPAETPAPPPASTATPTARVPTSASTPAAATATPAAIVEPDYCIDAVILAHDVSDGVLTLIHEVEAIRDATNAAAIDALLELLEAYDGPYDELLLEIGCDPSAW